MKTQTLETQVLDFLQGIQVGSESSAHLAERLFLRSVDFLRIYFPNPAIQRLAGALWETVTHEITPVAQEPPVRALTFVLSDSKTAPHGTIVLPSDWQERIRKDVLTQIGGVVFVGSQAVDYTNGRHQTDIDNVKVRAFAYEAEYLKTVRDLSPAWELSDYQIDILQKYPEGIATPKAHRAIYPVRPLIQA